jgi:RsmE family RNA methyltransferase
VPPHNRRGPRVFVPGLSQRISAAGSSPLLVSLPTESGHHLRGPLRLQVGAAVEVADPTSGAVFQGSLETLFPEVQVRVITELLHAAPTAPAESPRSTRAEQPKSADITAPHGRPIPPLRLLFALCKGQKNDLVCDWATELGCAQIIFWQSGHSIVRLDSEGECDHKQQRLAKIALSAAQQSRQLRPPAVHVVRSLTHALSLSSPFPDPAPLKLICSLREGARPIATVIAEHQAPSSIHLVVGPEGDLTEQEEAGLRAADYLPVRLGAAILRSELAAVTGLVTSQHVIELLSSQ